MLGFYDSGLGGVTIYQKVRELFPDFGMIYLADTQACPLGDKTERFIKKRVQKGVEFLFEQGAEIVVLACNTATAVALRDFQQNFLPKNYPQKNVLGVVRPISELLKEKSNNQEVEPVLILATKATIDSGYYQEDLKNHDIQKVFGIPCSGLADSIEDMDNHAINSILEYCLMPYNSQIEEAKSVILACTHYPIVKNEIESHLKKYGLDKNSLFLSQDSLTASKLKKYLEKHPEYKIKTGKTQFYSTADELDFQSKLKQIFGIKEVVLKCIL